MVHSREVLKLCFCGAAHQCVVMHTKVVVNTIGCGEDESGGAEHSGGVGNVPTSGGAFHLGTPGQSSAHQAKAHGTCTLVFTLLMAEPNLELLTSKG